MAVRLGCLFFMYCKTGATKCHHASAKLAAVHSTPPNAYFAESQRSDTALVRPGRVAGGRAASRAPATPTPRQETCGCRHTKRSDTQPACSATAVEHQTVTKREKR